MLAELSKQVLKSLALRSSSCGKRMFAVRDSLTELPAILSHLKTVL